MEQKVFFNVLPSLSPKSEFESLIEDMKNYTTTNVNFHQGDLLAHSAWTAYYVSELFDINSTSTSPLQMIYHEQLVKDFEAEHLFKFDIKKVLILAAFLHDIGKAGDRITNYYDKPEHEKTGALYLFNNNYKDILGLNINLTKMLNDFKIRGISKNIIICLVAGHWLIGDAMSSNAPDKAEYFVEKFINIVHNFILDSTLQQNIPFMALLCMMQLIICVADVLASQEYKGPLKQIKVFPQIPLEPATHPGIDAYNKFNYDDVIRDFVPKVLTLIHDGNNSDLDELINNASTISEDDFKQAIETLSHTSHNLDEVSDIIQAYIKTGDFKKVYLIVVKFPDYIKDLLGIIEETNSISGFIGYIITITSKIKINEIIGDIIYTGKIKFIEELIRVNFKFTPYFLNIAKKSYNDSLNDSDKIRSEEIFVLIKKNYDYSEFYIDDKHKIYCETLNNGLDTIPNSLQITTTRVLIPYEKILQENFSIFYLDMLPSISEGVIDISYNKDNYGGGFENTVEIEKGYQFHNDWINKSINYIKGLSYEDVFTLYGYTHNGDELSNKFLIGNNQSYLEFLNTHLYDGNSYNRYSKNYFPLFFQLLNLINKYDKTQLLKPREDSDFIDMINKTNKVSTKYRLLINNLDLFKIEIIKEATKQYIKDLDRIIKNGPPLSSDVVLYRGVKDKYYYPDPNNKTFVNNTFMSTSYTIFNAFEFANKDCCVKKIICKAGTPAIFLECITSHPRENEILLALNNKFRIIKDEVRNNMPVHLSFEEICENVISEMNVTTMVTE
jgi:hypothetical protein